MENHSRPHTVRRCRLEGQSSVDVNGGSLDRNNAYSVAANKARKSWWIPECKTLRGRNGVLVVFGVSGVWRGHLATDLGR
jgi:hypothetical protein